MTTKTAAIALIVIGVTSVVAYVALSDSGDRASRASTKQSSPPHTIATSISPVAVSSTLVSTASTSAAVNQTATSEAATQAVLVTSGTIQGRVVDAITGKPITEFKTKITTAYIDRTIERKSFSSPEGRFVVSGLNAARGYFVEVLAQGYAPSTQREIRTDGRGREVLFKLEHGTPLTLRLIDRESKLPIAGAHVVWSDRPTEIPETMLTQWKEDPAERTLDRLDMMEVTLGRLHASSDADGVARLTEKDASGILWLVATGYATGKVTPSERANYADSHGQLTIPLSKETSLEGVIYLDASPAAGAKVVLSGNGAPDLTGDTDDRGRYAFRYIAPGTYEVRILKLIGTSSVTVIERKVTLGVGEKKKLNIGDDLGDGTLFGLVLIDGKPAANYVVSAMPNFDWAYQTFEAATDENGGYRISGLRLGEYRIAVVPLGYGAGLGSLKQKVEVRGKTERNFEIESTAGAE